MAAHLRINLLEWYGMPCPMCKTTCHLTIHEGGQVLYTPQPDAQTINRDVTRLSEDIEKRRRSEQVLRAELRETQRRLVEIEGYHENQKATIQGYRESNQRLAREKREILTKLDQLRRILEEAR